MAMVIAQHSFEVRCSSVRGSVAEGTGSFGSKVGRAVGG